MAFCGQCGSQVDGAFCPKCGAANGAMGPNPAGPAAAGGLTDNMAGALCYALGLITGIVFLVLAPYNRNPAVRFHAFQSIFLNIAWIGLWIVLGTLTSMASIFALLLVPLYGILGLAGLAGWLFLMYRAYNNQPLVVPVLGPLAQQQAQAG